MFGKDVLCFLKNLFLHVYKLSIPVRFTELFVLLNKLVQEYAMIYDDCSFSQIWF